MSWLEQIFLKMCHIRYFEEGLIQAQKEGRIHCPVYLTYGQEAVSASIGYICEKEGYNKVFPQHRGHGIYLSCGGNAEALRDEILGLPTGCCQGNGGSSDIGCELVEAHHGLLGENIPLAVGYALASKKKTIAFFGDGAIEEDYALVALGFAATHSLPVLFVCEDNKLAILTKINERRSWSAVEVAEGFGIPGANIEDDPRIIVKTIKDKRLPFFVNISTVRHKWHVGIGEDETNLFDRLAVTREQLNFPEQEIVIAREMRDLWQKP